MNVGPWPSVSVPRMRRIGASMYNVPRAQESGAFYSAWFPVLVIPRMLPTKENRPCEVVSAGFRGCGRKRACASIPGGGRYRLSLPCRRSVWSPVSQPASIASLPRVQSSHIQRTTLTRRGQCPGSGKRAERGAGGSGRPCWFVLSASAASAAVAVVVSPLQA